MKLRHLLYAVVSFVVSVATVLLTVGPETVYSAALTLVVWVVLLAGTVFADHMLRWGPFD